MNISFAQLNYTNFQVFLFLQRNMQFYVICSCSHDEHENERENEQINETQLKSRR